MTLTSSVEQDGREAACPGEVVTFTCMVTEAGFLQWIAEPFIKANDSGFFPTINKAGDVQDPTPHIHIVLIEINDANDPRLRNYISTLTVNATTALNGTVIQCNNGFKTLIIESKLYHFCLIWTRVNQHNLSPTCSTSLLSQKPSNYQSYVWSQWLHCSCAVGESCK